MVLRGLAKVALISVFALTGCAKLGLGGSKAVSIQDGGNSGTLAQQEASRAAGIDTSKRQSTLSDLFKGGDNPSHVVGINKYIWNAALDVLNFLPIESVDPFTGVIVTGYGVPPNGGRAYRATVLIQDPALDARSLKLSMQTKGGGAVSPETLTAIEDAILTRARQLRIADSKL